MTLLELQNAGLAELLRQQGQAAPMRVRASDSILDPNFFNKQALRKLRSVDVEFLTLDSAIRTQPPGAISTDFVQPWDLQLAEWKRFKADTDKELSTVIDASIFSPFVPIPDIDAINLRINSFRDRLIGWDRSFRTRFPNIPIAGPIPQPESPELVPEPPRKPSSGFPWWATSLITLGVVGAVGYLGYKAYTSVTSGASILKLVRGNDVDRDPDYDEDQGGYEPPRRLERQHLPYPLPPRGANRSSGR